jgi:hypothetical protein
MKARVLIALLLGAGLTLSAASAAPPTTPRTCESDSTRQLLTCLKPCSGRVNDASTRVCKQQCMEKHEARKKQCPTGTKPRIVVF